MLEGISTTFDKSSKGIGIVVYYVRKFYDEESSFNLWSLFGAIMSSFFILWVMSYCNRWVKKRFERSED